jgi:uncharacterized membrane protein
MSLVLQGVAVLLLYFVALSAVAMLPGGEYIVIVVQLSAGLVFSAGWLLFCLRLVRGEPVTPAAMFEPFRNFGRIWAVSIAVSVLVAAGLFLFVIPGLYLASRFGLGVFAALDRGLSWPGALGASSAVTEGHRLQVLVLYGIMAGLYGLSVLPYIYGMGGLGAVTITVYNFAVTPVLGAAYAAAWDSLSGAGEVTP